MRLLLLGVICLIPVDDRAKLATPADVQEALTDVIRRHFPDADLKLSEDTFTASAQTMRFTLHRIMRDGSIVEKTHQGVGPRHNGFQIHVTRSPGRYRGPLATPQSLRQPYWSTFVNELVHPSGDSHLWIRYSFGTGIDRQFHHEVLLRLGARDPRKHKH